jgi:hypothetical protein
MRFTSGEATQASGFRKRVEQETQHLFSDDFRKPEKLDETGFPRTNLHKNIN